MSASATRRGSLLIVVTGLLSVVLALALAFLSRMRSDGEEGLRFAKDVQARLMLSAGLMYVQEAGRLGWGEETYGWRDVRDGMPGPRAFDGTWPQPLRPAMLDDGTGLGRFPAIGGKAARCPMYRMRRPPWAIKPDLAPNPVTFTGPSDPRLTLPWDQLINFTNPDPAPDYDPAAVDKKADFRLGRPAPVDGDVNPAWFRVYRSTALRFIITCGAGASRGFKDYDEALAEGEDGAFLSRAEFDEIRANETIMWYEAEWSDIVTGNNFLHLHYCRWNQRYIGAPYIDGDEQPNMRQQTGTFSYIQRLDARPANW